MNNKQESTILDKNHADLLVQLEDEQRKSGYLSAEFLNNLARAVDMPLSEIYGVVSFYSFLTVRPQGRNVIRICKNLPCSLKHSDMIRETIARELGIKVGETTKDGRFTLTLTNCIGACDKAPAMMINNDVHGDLTQEKIVNILRSYR